MNYDFGYIREHKKLRVTYEGPFQNLSMNMSIIKWTVWIVKGFVRTQGP